MNRTIKYSLMGTMLGLGLFLGGCDITPPTIVGISLAGEMPSEFLINEFDYEDFSINVEFSNNTIKEIPLTEEMLNTVEYLDAIKKEGDHTLTITYGDFQTTYSFTVKKYEFSDVYIQNETIVYDGEYHSLSVKGNIPNNTKIEFVDKNSYKNAGEYTVTARLANEYYVTKTITGTLTIEKASYDSNKIKFENAEYVYDGKPHSVEVSGLDSSVKVSYKIGNDETNKAVDAGVYTVVAHFESASNYNQIPDMTATLTIKKATYDMEAFTFVDKTVYYTGDVTDMHISNETLLPTGVSVSYIGLNDAINAGKYEITARFTGDSNYEDIPDKKATLTIKPAVVGLTGVYLDSVSIVYDGKEHGIEYSGSKPNSIVSNGYTIYNQEGNLVYDSNSTDSKYRHKPVDVGTYVVYAHFSYRDNKNYDAIEPLSAVLIITKADITDIVIENETKEYIPGMGQSLTVKMGMNGITAIPSIPNPVDPGDYLITYTFSLSEELAKNYNVPDPITRTLSITKRNIFASKNTQNKYTAVYDGKLHGIDINLSVDEAKWIQPYFFYYDEFNVEQEFKGFSEPGTYLIFATFTILDTAPANYEDYYYIPSRASAYLTIQKKQIEFNETWLANRMNMYDGATVTVKLNETTKIEGTNLTGLESLLAANLGLNAGDFKITYRDNIQTDGGYYTGSLDIEVISAKTKYFDNLYNYEFHYAIKKANGGGEVNPIVVQKTFTYDGKAHSIELANIPEGISLKYEGDTNSLTLPGTKDVIILFHADNDVAKWYYSFPGLAVSTLSGEPQLFLQLTVLHIDYVEEIETPTYTYELGSENREVYPKHPTSGVNLTFIYDDEERVDVGKYGVTVQLEITSPDLLMIYNPTNVYRVEFEIVPDEYRFSFAGLSAIYDGNKHNVIVSGIDEEIELGYISYQVEDQQGHVIDGYTDVGIYNVFIRFNNMSKNYKDVPNQSLQLVIETSKVNTQDLVDYVNNTTYGRTSQLESVYSFLNNIIDTTPFDVVYKIDYYFAAENPQYPDDELFHGQGTTEDFTFTQYTSDTGFALLEFTVTFKKGYESKDGAFTDYYHGFIRIKVNEINKYDLTSVFNALRYSHTIDQGRTLDSEYLSSISNLDYSYTCEYLNGTEAYDERYEYRQGSSEDEIPFSFAYNTYGNRKVKVNLTIPQSDNYIYFDGVHSLLTIDETFYFDVNIVDTIDIYETSDGLKSVTDMYQLTKYDTYVKQYYNDSLYSLDYSIVDENETKVADKSNEGIMKKAGSYTVNITLTANEGLVFNANGSNVYTLSVPLTVEDVEVVYIEDFLDSYDALSTTLYQYGSIYKDIADKLTFPEGLKVEYTLVKCTDATVSGVLNDLKDYSYDNPIDSNLVFYDFNYNIPEASNRVLLYVTLTPYDSSAVLLENDTLDSEIYGTKLVLDVKSFEFKPRVKVEYYYLYGYTRTNIENHGSYLEQNRRLSEYLEFAVNDKTNGYHNEELVNIGFNIKYIGNGFEKVIATTWDDLNKVVPTYNNWTSNDKISITIYIQAVRENVVITANPNIPEKRYREINVGTYPVHQIETDTALESRLAQLDYSTNKVTVNQFQEMSSFVKKQVGAYISTGGPSISGYSIELVNKDTNKNDASFIKVNKNITDEYVMNTKNESNTKFKLTLKFNNSGATKYVLGDDGVLANTVEKVIYFDVQINPDAFYASEAANYTVPLYTQFDKVADTLKNMTISNQIKINKWEITFRNKSGGNYVISGTMDSSTIISKNFKTEGNYDENGEIKIYYEKADTNSLVVKDGKLLDSDLFYYTYTFIIDYLKKVDISSFETFVNQGKLYYLGGHTPKEYTDYYLGNIEGITVSQTNCVYSDDNYNHSCTENTKFPADANWFRSSVYVECKNGYYLSANYQGAVKYKTFNINKAIKTPVDVDTARLVQLSDRGLSVFNKTISGAYLNYDGDAHLDEEEVRIDYYLDSQKLSGHVISKETLIIGGCNYYESYSGTWRTASFLEWEVVFTGKSTQAIHFTNEGLNNPVGYTTLFPDDAPYNGVIEIWV